MATTTFRFRGLTGLGEASGLVPKASLLRLRGVHLEHLYDTASSPFPRHTSRGRNVLMTLLKNLSYLELTPPHLARFARFGDIEAELPSMSFNVATGPLDNRTWNQYYYTPLDPRKQLSELSTYWKYRTSIQLRTSLGRLPALSKGLVVKLNLEVNDERLNSRHSNAGTNAAADRGRRCCVSGSVVLMVLGFGWDWDWQD